MLYIIHQWEMKTKDRYHYISDCVSKIWKNDNANCGTMRTLILEGKTVQPLFRWFLTKVNILLPNDPATVHFSLVNSIKVFKRALSSVVLTVYYLFFRTFITDG